MIRYATLDEAPALMEFIGTHWKAGHILSTNQELLDYQHRNERDNRYNFVVSVDSHGNFQAILGFIPKNQYDPDWDNKDIWLAIWKKADGAPRGCGTALLDFLEDDYRPTSIGSIGINDSIEKLYLGRGWQSGFLDHWYFVKHPKLITLFDYADYRINAYSKTSQYYSSRFLDNTFYQYTRFGGIIFRRIENSTGACLRIVDFEYSFKISPNDLNWLLDTEGADYIDCLNYGMPEGVFESMGFHKTTQSIFIPNRFEPFDQKGNSVKFAYKSDKPYFIVKGDSDQDRPNQL